jgi:hypothetical protein
MRILDDQQILEYCSLNIVEREAHLSTIDIEPLKPVVALPVFELCRAAYFLVHRIRAQVNYFRDCWSYVSNWHQLNQGYGYNIHVYENVEENIVREFVELGEVQPDLTIQDHKDLVIRIRNLQKKGIHLWDDENQHPWAANPPEGMSVPVHLYESPEDDLSLVIDTNNLLKILNEIPDDLNILRNPSLSGILPDKIRQRVRNLFERPYGLRGRLIIPEVVLEESERVSRTKPSEYSGAFRTLHAIALNPESPLWQAFRFESLSQTVFECFLQLLEGLVPHSTADTPWPGYADLLILSHGLANGCPIASNEWVGGGDWNVVRRAFPQLCII